MHGTTNPKYIFPDYIIRSKQWGWPISRCLEKLKISLLFTNIPHVWWKHKVYYLIHNSQPLVLILIHSNPFYILPPHPSRHTLVCFSNLRLDLPSGDPCTFVTANLWRSWIRKEGVVKSCQIITLAKNSINSIQICNSTFGFVWIIGA
jgi:hypothetical protein